MNQAKVKKALISALNIKGSDIEKIEPAGGMTNFNFKVRIKGENFIARLPGRGTDELISRETELENLDFATELGINPEYIYFDINKGIKVTRKINGAKSLTEELAKKFHIQKSVIKVFHKLHQSKKEMNNEFKLFSLIKNYERLVQEESSIWKEYKTTKDRLGPLIDLYVEDRSVKKVPCHIDPTYTNFVFGEEGTLYLIDWEYSGMFDPLWDLAAFSFESNLTKEEEENFLTKYFKRKPQEKERKYILLHKIFQDYLWSLWTFYKESQGSEFGRYGMMRLKRAKENINLFYQKYF